MFFIVILSSFRSSVNNRSAGSDLVSTRRLNSDSTGTGSVSCVRHSLSSSFWPKKSIPSVWIVSKHGPVTNSSKLFAKIFDF